MENTYHKYFKDAHRSRELFLKDKYDVLPYMTNGENSNIRNMLSRIRNQFAKAVNKNLRLPKAIIFVLDDDLIRWTDYEKAEGARDYFGKIVSWLVNEVRKMVMTRKDQFPTKAITPNQPVCYWTEAPQHKNFDNNLLRRKFNSALYEITDLQTNMHVLKMKKIWDYNDTSLFRNDRFTSEGLLKYWESIDSSFKFNEELRSHPDSATARKPNNDRVQSSRFKWYAKKGKPRYKLPSLKR